MSNKLANALKTVISERGMADNLSEAAKKIGVAYLSLRNVIEGSARPNKATAARYQAFLGVDNDDFANLFGPKADKPAKPSKPEKAAKIPKTPKAPKVPTLPKEPKVSGVRGRPRRTPAAETEEVPTPTTSSYVDTNESEKDMTRAIAVTTEPSYAHQGTAEALERALVAMQGVLKDDLALRVHAAPAGVRALIHRMLG